mmetsp:Transcript_26606/g.64656  ORF Transcript_26606/g.64656 Transcript_26606/m.64656 type:complete len:206 (+) Transcript_26606:138-755(+)
MLSILLTGSAAPHRSWSPTVKQERYSSPMLSFLTLPTGHRRVPDTCAGESCLSVASLVLGTRTDHSLYSPIAFSISASGIACLSLMVMAWLWHLIAPTRTQVPSMGMGVALPRILLASAWPFHSSLVWPFSIAASIHGISEPANGAPKLAVGSPSTLPARISETLRSRSRMLALSSISLGSTLPAIAPICATSSRMFFAPAPEAA